MLNNVRHSLINALKASSDPDEARAFLRYVRLQLYRRRIDRFQRDGFWQVLRDDLSKTSKQDFRGPEVLAAALFDLDRYAGASLRPPQE